ncbi:BQ2448_3049 [Microbotryum intermedium]|uniref:BQ2448_3049 protein n=1 Tax=Microbotryum intermedium TaxID=269621 RepID=A0A238FH49_9BASI|nr:BQ2448_3049 [Microbotryum intermedium]
MGSSSKTQVYSSTQAHGGVSGSSPSTMSSSVGSLLRRAGSASGTVGAGSSSRHQARLGVTTDYVDLSLHSACANGNVGLVKYALQHGQPVNSVLNGVLPLHAAASSGNEQIVRMLIAAGADVNSPRLPRRYSNEKTRASGIAVGTAGSIPLHFAAANGHADVIKILLQYGAKPNALEKYDLTPEMIAEQKGHLEAAQLLRERSEGFEDDASSINQGRASSSSSLRLSLSKKRLHPRRSLDALAVSLQQHASNPHLLLAQRSPNAVASTSLHSIGQSITSPGASGEVSGPSTNKMLLTNHPVHEAHSARRPSLPSVFEKAARPTAALKHAFGLGHRGSSDGPSGRVLRKSSSKSSLSASVWGKDPHGDFVEDEEDLYGYGTEADELEDEDLPIRRKSEEITRSNSKRDSVGSLTSIRETPSTAPPTKTTFAPDHSMGPPPPPASLSRSGSISAASAASFYRPRNSSQLSGRVVSSTPQSPQSPQSPSSNVQVFIDDEDEATPVNSTLRQRTLTAGSPSSRASPLVAPGWRRETSATSSQFSPHTPAQSQLPSGIVTPDSMLTSSRATSDDGASGSHSSRTRSRGETHVPSSIGSRTTVEPARRGAGFVVRNRTDSASSTASSALSRRHLSIKIAGLNVNEGQRRTVSTSPALLPEPVVKKAETRTSRSNSAGTDGRFSSSPASSYSGLGTLSTYAPSTNSTTPTSIATSKSSHNASPVPQYHARLPGLSPLYESSPNSSPSTNNTKSRQHLQSGGHITTSAEARTRVKKVEQELLEFAASASSASGASTTKNTAGAAAVPMSLTDKLAAYGQGLALERRLKAIEKNGGATPPPGASGGFRFETIGTSSSKAAGSTSEVEGCDSASPTSTTTASKLTVPVPQWRAIPPVDRLMPPAAAAASGRRSVSPVSGLSHGTATHSPTMPVPSRKSSKDSESTQGITFVPIAASTNAGSGSSTAPPTRASSPSSSRSAKSQTHTLRNTVASSSHHQHGHHPHHHHHSSHPSTSSASASMPVQIHQPQAILGIGDKGVSYVEAVVPPSSSPATSHHRSSMPKNETLAVNRSSRGGGSSVKSVQEQVDSEALEQARLAAIFPVAPITRPKKRRGFANKLFGK